MDINLNRKIKFRTKLCLYFLIFTLIIFSVLWLLQTVFLQNFYNHMLIKNTRNAAEKIENEYKNFDAVDEIARENSLLVFLTDTDGNFIYSTDEYKSNYHKNSYENDEKNNENPYRQNEKLSYETAQYRALPDGYDEFLKELKEKNGQIEIQNDTHFIFGKILKNDEVLYINTTLDPVGSAANIIQIQLLWVSILSIFVSIILSYYFSKKFARPVSELSYQARYIGDKNFENNFQKGFCAEIDELEDTLISTNEKLKNANTYQQELLANVSHDLRTPLTMIRGYAESIKDFGDDEKQRFSDSDIIIRETD